MAYQKIALNTTEYEDLETALNNAFENILEWDDVTASADVTTPGTTSQDDALDIFVTPSGSQSGTTFVKFLRGSTNSDNIIVTNKNSIDIPISSGTKIVRGSNYIYSYLIVGDNCINLQIINTTTGINNPIALSIYKDNNGKVCCLLATGFSTATSDYEDLRNYAYVSCKEGNYHTILPKLTTGSSADQYSANANLTMLCPLPSNDDDNGYSENVFFVPYKQEGIDFKNIISIGTSKYLMISKCFAMKLE
jgi:hypothetical protein